MEHFQPEEAAEAHREELRKMEALFWQHVHDGQQFTDETLHSLGVIKATPLDVDGATPIDFEPRFFAPSYHDEHLVHANRSRQDVMGLVEMGRDCDPIWVKTKYRDQNDYESGEWVPTEAHEYPFHRWQWFDCCVTYMLQTQLDEENGFFWSDHQGRATQAARTDGWRLMTLVVPEDDDLRWPEAEGRTLYKEPDYTWYSISEPRASGKPHLSIVMGDTAVAGGDHEMLASELNAAITMSKRQITCGRFPNHHTKPIIIFTFMHETFGRITQAYFDAKINKLVVRQSRLLDFQSDKPSPDGYLFLRWMMSTAIGETEYNVDKETQIRSDQGRLPFQPNLVKATAS